MTSPETKGAVVGFITLLCKGLMDDERWDWDVEKCNWDDHQWGFTDPTVLKTTVSIFMNNLNDRCDNYEDARFRAFQYFRMMITGHTEKPYKVEKWFSAEEFEEPDWYIWDGRAK